MSAGQEKLRDTEFLVDEFGVKEAEAAELVTGKAREDTETMALARKVRRNQNPLDEKPTPQEPERDFVEDSDEQALKPVLKTKNDRQGAG